MAQGFSFRWMIVWFCPLFFSLIVGHSGQRSPFRILKGKIKNFKLVNKIICHLKWMFLIIFTFEPALLCRSWLFLSCLNAMNVHLSWT